MSQVEPASTPPPLPVPVQPLTYPMALQYGRPGLITALGVLCLVVACFSGLFSLVTAYMGAMGYMGARFSGMAASTATVSGGSMPLADETVGVDEAGIANNALQQLLSLNPAGFRELDYFIHKHGRAVFGPDDNGPLTSPGIGRAIVQYKSRTASANSNPSFTTAFGTLEIFPDHARFTSADGTRTLTTAAANHSESDTNFSTSSAPQVNTHVTIVGATTNLSQTTTLTPAQVQRVLSAVRKMAPKPLNSAQLNALQAQLSMPDQQLVSSNGTSPVTSVFPQGNNVMIQLDSSSITLGPKGQVVQMFSFGPTTVAGGPALSGPPNIRRIGTAAWLIAAESLGSIAVAVYLLVVGSLMFRPTVDARRLLRIYVWLKIPLALVCGSALIWMAYEISIAAAGAGPRLTTMLSWALVAPALGLAFPIAVIFTLRARSVKTYYDSAASS